jgi:osmotically inducible protein OsmC
MRTVYTATAQVRGGREAGRGVTPDGALDVALRSPPELGGEGGGTNPEQLLAVGFAACFESAIGVVARRARVDPGEVEIASRVMLRLDRRDWSLAVELAVSLPAVDDLEQAVELVRLASETCPYSKATRGNIDVRLTANGAEVAA